MASCNTLIPCQDCGIKVPWSGTGRKPKRCKSCGRKAKTAATVKTNRRTTLHMKGKAASRFGELWLVDGKPIRREARYVWGSTGDNDDTVTNRSGVFHAVGKDGLPGEGFTTSHKDLQGRLIYLHKQSRAEAKEWLLRHEDWWRIESFAHDVLSRDVTESVVMHGSSHSDEIDEHTPGERCSWCVERRPLVLAGEFCCESCMADYVRAFGAHGLELDGGWDVGDDARGLAESGDHANDAVVCGAGA
jgi:hypothetical protein